MQENQYHYKVTPDGHIMTGKQQYVHKKFVRQTKTNEKQYEGGDSWMRDWFAALAEIIAYWP